MITLYNVISKDGFIATEDGSEDFIPDKLWNNFIGLCQKYKTVLLSRKSYDAIGNYEPEMIEAFEKLPIRKIVLTRNEGFKPKEGYTVMHNLEDLKSEKGDIIATCGPTLNNYLLQEGLVNKIILIKISAVLGRGIKPYDKQYITPSIFIDEIIEKES